MKLLNDMKKHNLILIFLLISIITALSIYLLFITNLTNISAGLNANVVSETTQLNAKTLAKLIVEYDYQLTSASENYIETSDSYWKDSYDYIGLKLDDTIKQLQLDAVKQNNQFQIELFNRLNISNTHLVEMELKAHSLVKEGKLDEAKAIIQGDEYKKYKEIYSETINEYLKSLGVEPETNYNGQINDVLLQDRINMYVDKINDKFNVLYQIPDPSEFMLSTIKNSVYEDISTFDDKFSIVDGALRTNISYYNQYFNSEDMAGVMLYSNYNLTNDTKKIMLVLNRDLKTYAISTNKIFINRYTTLENGIDSMYPNEWIFKVGHDDTFKEDLWYSIVNPQNNPNRESKWTPVYYDSVLNYWMVSFINPIYDGDEFIGTTGGDITLKDISNQIKSYTYDGAGYSFIFDNDKNIIVHPAYNSEIEKKGEMQELFSFNDIREKELSIIISSINDAKGQKTFNYDGKEYLFIYNKLNSIDWYYGFVIESDQILAQVSLVKNNSISIDKTLEHSLLLKTEQSKQSFYELKDNDIYKIKSLLIDFMKKDDYKMVFLEHNRTKLYEYSLDLFNLNKKDFRVTHFYYIYPNSTNFLRVHVPEQYGDLIKRTSFQKSVESNSFGTGLELGKTAFALRVVHPYYYNDSLIGYVEFSEEINHFIKQLKLENGLDYGIIIKKSAINKADWLNVRATQHLRNNYDDMSKYIVIDSTGNNLVFDGSCFTQELLDKVTISGNILGQCKLGQKTYITSGFILYDANNTNIGVVVLVHDVSEFIGVKEAVGTINLLDNAKLIYCSVALVCLIIILLYYLSINKRENDNVNLCFKLIMGASLLIILSSVTRTYTNNIFIGVLAGKFMLIGWLSVLFSLLLMNYYRLNLKKSIHDKFICIGITGIYIITVLIISFTNYALVGGVANGKGIDLILGPFFNIIWIGIFIISLFNLAWTFLYKTELDKSFVSTLLLNSMVCIIVLIMIITGVMNLRLDYLHIIAPLLIIMLVGNIFYHNDNLKVKHDFLLLTLGLFLIIIIGLLIISTYETTQFIKENTVVLASEKLMSLADTKEQEVNNYFEQQKIALEVMATQSDLTNEELDSMLVLTHNFNELFVLDSKGIVVQSSDISQIGKDKSNKSYFINGRQTYISYPYYSDAIHKEVIAISTPFHSGVLVARLDLDTFNEFTSSRIGIGETGEIVFAYRNTNGDAVFFTKQLFDNDNITSNTVVSKDNIYIPITQALLKNERLFLDVKDYGDIPVYAVSKYFEQADIAMVVKVSKAEILETSQKLINKIWLFILGLILAIMLLGLIFIFLLTKSLRKEVKDKTNILEEQTNQLQVKTLELETNISNLKNSKTAIMNMMDDLNETNLHLKDLDVAKTNFLNVASHELKTPLTAISAYLDVLDDYKGEFNAEQLKGIDAIRRNNDQLKMLINNILEISRIESGRFEMNAVEIDVRKKILMIVENLKILEHPGVILKAEVPDVLPKLMFDDMRFDEILNNLISNAIKFTDKGSITIKANAEAENFISIEVIDTGIGIPEDKIKNLFQNFYQVDSSISRKYGGTGLGLALTKKMIEHLGGKISVTSVVGKGTAFKVLLPLIQKKDNINATSTANNTATTATTTTTNTVTTNTATNNLKVNNTKDK